MHTRRRRHRRNAPWGSMSSEYERVGKNRTTRARRKPRKIRSSSGRSGVLLGKLDELVVLRPGGDQTVSDRKISELFVAWMPGTNNLALVRKAKDRPGRITERDARIFQQFHKSAPKRATTYDWPDADRLRPLGRLRSLTYIVPKWVKSLEKWNYKWVHAFGDHGESGHGEHTGTKSYPTKLMPMLCKDTRGNLHIVRQPGNKYRVSEWIYW